MPVPGGTEPPPHRRVASNAAEVERRLHQALDLIEGPAAAAASMAPFFTACIWIGVAAVLLCAAAALAWAGAGGGGIATAVGVAVVTVVPVLWQVHYRSALLSMPSLVSHLHAALIQAGTSAPDLASDAAVAAGALRGSGSWVSRARTLWRSTKRVRDARALLSDTAGEFSSALVAANPISGGLALLAAVASILLMGIGVVALAVGLLV